LLHCLAENKSLNDLIMR